MSKPDPQERPDFEKAADKKQTPYDGKKALIIGDHPHNGSLATCICAEMTGNGWALRFKDQINEFFVFKPDNVKWIQQ